MKSVTDKPRNFVKKHSDQINKPKVFRNRKKKEKMEGNDDWKDDIKPKHRPYRRQHEHWEDDE